VPATDELSILGGAARYLFQSILSVRDTDLSAATPCHAWDLRQLLCHIRASLQDLTDILALRELDVDMDTAVRPLAETNLVAALRIGIVDLLLAAAALPSVGRFCEIWGRVLPARTVVHVAAIEMVLHAWDISQACRTDHPIPVDLASTLLAVAPPLAEAGLARQVFAKPTGLATAANPSEQLLALFGR
jgi:uncharacterized protein (TIGR03086 family)